MQTVIMNNNRLLCKFAFSSYLPQHIIYGIDKCMYSIYKLIRYLVVEEGRPCKEYEYLELNNGRQEYDIKHRIKRGRYGIKI